MPSASTWLGSIHFPSLVPAVTDHVVSWDPHPAELDLLCPAPMLLGPQH